jgi:prepilin-type N-terminal cleavage/methylation domain-containing protein
MSAPRVSGDEGLTLVEILAAVAVIAIALVAMIAAIHHGLSGIDTGRGESTAVFLVEDKLEELRSVALADWGNAALAPGTTVEYCQLSNGCAPTPTPTSFRRTTTVHAGSEGACSASCKIVNVSVAYRPVTMLGQLDQERRVDVQAMFAPRT